MSRRHSISRQRSKSVNSLGERTALLAEHQGTTEPAPVSQPVRRKVVDSLPLSVWGVILFEFCERFAFAGLSGPLQNYMQLAPSLSARPSGLGMSQRAATTLKLFFWFWCYITPMFGAILADQYIGRLKTILYASWVYITGLVVLCGSSTLTQSALWIPRTLAVVAMVLIGLGTGGIKTNVNPLLAEQYQPPENKTLRLRSGEVVEVDYEGTIQRIFMTFYVIINIGSMSSLFTTIIESSPHGGFPLAFLLPLCIFILSTILFLLTKRNYKAYAPTGSVLPNAGKVVLITLCHGFRLSAASPSRFPSGVAHIFFGLPLRITYTEDFPDQVRGTLRACRVFIFFPLYWAAYTQMLSNFISQAGSMDSHGIPNDVLIIIAPLIVIALVPLLDRVIYPLLRRIAPRIFPRPLVRIFVGFLLCSGSLAYAAFVQSVIYASPPCFRFPLTKSCPHANDVHIALQIPAYVMMAVSEVFVSVTGLEYAFMQAPRTMKSLVMAVYLSMSACGAVLAGAFAPLTEHPRLVWLYGAIAIMVGVGGVAFGFVVFVLGDDRDPPSGEELEEDERRER